MASDLPGDTAGGDIELADAVEAVRQGLITGAARGAGQAVRFEIGEIHMEFTVALERVRTGSGGIKAVVVEAGGETSRTASRTHTVSFTLRPKDAATGGYLEIGAPDSGYAPSPPPGPRPYGEPSPGTRE